MSKLQEPNVPTPKTEQDRAFLIVMYEEHAEHARQHENLRATVATIFIALIAGIFTYAGADTQRLRMSGLLICAISVFGWLLNVKHHERDSMHRTVLSGFRKALQNGLTPDIEKINKDFRDYHKAQWPIFSEWVRLHYLWAAVYAITFTIGIIMIIS